MPITWTDFKLLATNFEDFMLSPRMDLCKERPQPSCVEFILLGLPAADKSSFVMLTIIIMVNMFGQKIKLCMDSVARFSQYSTGL